MSRAIPSPIGGRLDPTMSAGGDDVVPTEERFVPTLGQTVFTLSLSPMPGTVTFRVSGQAFSQLGGYFTQVGTTITWLDVPFSLTPDDEIVIVYFT